MHLGHFVGNGAQGGDGTERNAPEVHVESGHDDAHATIGQFVAYVDKPFVEELCLVDAHHVDVAS